MNIFVKRYMIPLLVLALLVLSLETLRAFFMDNVIEPIALVLWTAWRIIASVDQSVYWIILIAVCFILIIRLVPNSTDNTIKGSYKYTYTSRNRVEHWKSLVTEAARGKEDAETLRDDMKKLLVSAIRDTKESGPVDLEKITVTRNVPLSPEARRFLFSPKELDRKFSSGSWFNSMLLRTAWLRRSMEKLNSRDIRLIDEILRWIETEMEINDDR